MGDGKLVSGFDIVEKSDGCEDPPGIARTDQQYSTDSDRPGDSPAEGFVRPGVFKQVIDVVKVSEVGVYFDHPVRLRKDDGTDEDPTRISRKERFDLHPGDDIVQGPRRVQRDCAD